MSRPLIRSSRGRSGALVGWDGCEVRLCVRVPVRVPAPPGVFFPGTAVKRPGGAGKKTPGGAGTHTRSRYTMVPPRENDDFFPTDPILF